MSKKRIYYYLAEIEVISNNGKTKTTFKDSFPHLEGLSVGTITDSKLIGHFKMTRKETNATYRIVSIDILSDLGMTCYDV
jgi:hypothetical protein